MNAIHVRLASRHPIRAAIVILFSTLLLILFIPGYAFASEDPTVDEPTDVMLAEFHTENRGSINEMAWANNKIFPDYLNAYHTQYPPVFLDVRGNLLVGETLICKHTHEPEYVFSYQWARSDSVSGPFTDIAGATTKDYVTTDDDAQKYLRCTATYRGIVYYDTVGSVLDNGSYYSSHTRHPEGLLFAVGGLAILVAGALLLLSRIKRTLF